MSDSAMDAICRLPAPDLIPVASQLLEQLMESNRILIESRYRLAEALLPEKRCLVIVDHLDDLLEANQAAITAAMKFAHLEQPVSRARGGE